eukprot:scaffold38650_cov36-Phaeocystis_antarctica.AAC.3
MYLVDADLAAELAPALALGILLEDREWTDRERRASSGAAAAIPGVVALGRIGRVDQPRVLTRRLAGGAAHELGRQRRRRQRWWRRLGGCPGEEERDRAGGGGKGGGGFHPHAQVEGIDVEVDWLEELEQVGELLDAVAIALGEQPALVQESEAIAQPPLERGAARQQHEGVRARAAVRHVDELLAVFLRRGARLHVEAQHQCLHLRRGGAQEGR